jgi:uncharacterized protein
MERAGKPSFSLEISFNFNLFNFMVRPRLCRRVGFNPSVTYFKPQGVSLRQLEIVELTAEEAESLRLCNMQDLDQEDAAQKMNTSRSTFQRILSSASKKVADALINGKAIKIIK